MLSFGIWIGVGGGGGGEYTYVYIFGVDPALQKGGRLPFANIPADEWENRSAQGEKKHWSDAVKKNYDITLDEGCKCLCLCPTTWSLFFPHIFIVHDAVMIILVGVNSHY